MGEARARRRREDVEHKPAAQYAPQVQQLEEERIYLPKAAREQVRLRFEKVKSKFPTYRVFLSALVMAGVDMFDAEFAALDAHQRGESTPVEKAPEPERLVVSSDEVSPAHARALVRMHEANLLGGKS